MVYVVNCKQYNYANAKQYGEIVAVTKDHFPLFITHSLIRTLKQNLEPFTEEDYLLLAGSSWITAVASAMLLLKFTTVKFLIFDAKEQKYIVKHLGKDDLYFDSI